MITATVLQVSVAPGALGAALMIGCAVWLFLPSGSGRLVTDPAADPLRARLAGWLPAPRPGALALKSRLRLGAMAGAALGIVAGWLSERWWLGVLAMLVCGAATTLGLGQVESSAERSRRARLQRDLPQGLELMAAVLDAGLPMRSALQVVSEVVEGPLRDKLGSVCSIIELGESETIAWRTLASDPDLGMAVRDLARSAEHGIPVAEVLAVHADTARADRHAAAERTARTVGVSAVLPLMICFLPAFVLIGIVPIVAGALLPIIGAFSGS